MVRLYSDDDLYEAVMQKRRILAVFYGVSAVCLAAFIALLVYYVLLPYEDPNKGWSTALACIDAALYIAFLFPYMGICFKRSRAYCKMLRFLSVGLKECSVLPFVGIEDWTTRDGVDVNVATFSVKNIKRDEEMLRQIYVDGEKDFPPFEAGKYAKLITQGNLLVEYELTDEEQSVPNPAPVESPEETPENIPENTSQNETTE